MEQGVKRKTWHGEIPDQYKNRYEENSGWLEFLYRDPLRGVFSFDEFPYRRPNGQIEIDFIIKGFIYGVILSSSLWMWEAMIIIVSGWVCTNYLRRNSK